MTYEFTPDYLMQMINGYYLHYSRFVYAQNILNMLYRLTFVLIVLCTFRFIASISNLIHDRFQVILPH